MGAGEEAAKEVTAKRLQFIAGCENPEELRQMRKNALARGATNIADAAFRRIAALVPAEKPGTLEHDFWQTILAFEELLTEERGKTIRLARTRQKVARVGIPKTLEDWAMSASTTEGFKDLIERGMPELTGEAVVLRHADRFPEPVVAAARQRLEAFEAPLAA